ncbi:MAG: siderophore-interacting protein [Nocardioides sp.]|nr:siderophore-interacting protein [Nocardioides sp.]
MSTRAQQHAARVLHRDRVSEHLVRLELDVPDFVSTGVPDEWVGLVVPGQFQSRYYTVREHRGGVMVLDVVVHDEGLVTEWAARDVTGDEVTILEAKGSFRLPADAAWLILVGDLTAMPAMARIAASVPLTLPTRIWAEVPDDLPGYLPDSLPSGAVTWLRPPAEGHSDLAAVVEAIDWPAGEGYFWMAGESGAMRAIRKHLMRERRLPSTAYDVMGYWRGGAVRAPRAVDPGPIYRAGKAAGRTDDEIWAAYDAAREP